jgi:hypothetical protein
MSTLDASIVENSIRRDTENGKAERKNRGRVCRDRILYLFVLAALTSAHTEAFQLQSIGRRCFQPVRKMPIVFSGDVDAAEASVEGFLEVDDFANTISPVADVEPSSEASTSNDGDYSGRSFFYADLAPPLYNTTSSLVNIDVAGQIGEISRREWLQKGALLFGGAILAGTTLSSPTREQTKPVPKSTMPKAALPKTAGALSTPPKAALPPKPAASTSAVPAKKASSPQSQAPTRTDPVEETGKLEPVNLTSVASETNINVTLDCQKGCLTVDQKNFTKLRTAKRPAWYPSFLSPPSPKIVKVFPNSELFVASIVAGSLTEMVRTSILYPVQTIKTRIQVDAHNFTMRAPPIEKQIIKLGTNVRRYAKEGNLYAGITPTLLVSVPATGVYYGIRDVAKRMLSMTPISDVAVALSAAFMADVVSLLFRTPGDALALRLQAQDEEGDWSGDSLKRLPVVIATDLPYLLSKILLNRLFIHGSISIDRYTEFAIFSAVVAAFLTTPFDVARTRILVDSDGDFTNGIDGGSGDNLFEAMKKISKEGEGGVANLFAGWLERVLYLGIGRAWLEPLQIIGYVGIRDAVLLQWF